MLCRIALSIKYLEAYILQYTRNFSNTFKSILYLYVDQSDQKEDMATTLHSALTRSLISTAHHRTQGWNKKNALIVISNKIR